MQATAYRDPDAMTVILSEAAGAVGLSAATFRLLIDCALIGIEEVPDDHPDAYAAGELRSVLQWVQGAFAKVKAA